MAFADKEMRYFVKINSRIIFPALSLIDIIGIILSAICFVLDLNSLSGVTPLDEAEDLGFFESLLGPPLLIFFLAMFGVFAIILIVECILKLRYFIKAVAQEDYGEYLALSIFGLAEMVVNSIMVFVGTSIAVNLDGVHSAERAVIEEGLLIWFLVYVVLGILTILNIAFAGFCVKEEKAGRVRRN